jgi:hypothetical protein
MTVFLGVVYEHCTCQHAVIYFEEFGEVLLKNGAELPIADLI